MPDGLNKNMRYDGMRACSAFTVIQVARLVERLDGNALKFNKSFAFLWQNIQILQRVLKN